MSAGFKLPNRAPPSVSGGSASASPSPSSPPQLSPATASSAQSLINQLFSENEIVRNENAALRKSLDDLKAQLAAAQAGAQQLDSLKAHNSQLSQELERANQNIQDLQVEIESQSQQVMQAQQAAQQAAAAAAAAAAAFANPTRPAAASTSLGMGGAPMNRASVASAAETRAPSASISRGQFKPGTSGVPPPSESAQPPASAAVKASSDGGDGASVGMSRAMIRRKSRAQIQASAALSDDMAGKDTVTALYDYTAQRPEEVSFKEGDVFVVTEKDSSGWWRGLVRGQEGLFPSNYTKPNAA